MQQKQLLLAQAIDPTPLTLSSHLPVKRAVELMSWAWENRCQLPENSGEERQNWRTFQSAHCALVLKNHQLEGIFTEQDVVKLVTSGKVLSHMTLAEVIRPPSITLEGAQAGNIFSAITLLEQHKTRYLPIVDAQQHLLGLVTPQSISNALELTDLQRECRVADVMQSHWVMASPKLSVFEVAQQMSQKGASCVILTLPLAPSDAAQIDSNQTNSSQTNSAQPNSTQTQEQRPVGIMTEHDILQLHQLGLDLAQTPAERVMSKPVFDIRPNDSVWFAHQRMQQYRIRHLTVTNHEGALVGLMTQSLVMRAIEPLEIQQIFRTLRNQHPVMEPLQFLQKRTTKLVEDVQTYHTTFHSQTEQAELFAAIASRIRQFLNLEDILNRAVAEVRDFLQTDRVLIYQFAADMSGQVTAESVGKPWSRVLSAQIEDTCFQQEGAEAYRQGRRRAIANLQTSDLSPCHIKMLERFEVKASLVVPIVLDERLWGLLVAHQCSSPRDWQVSELDVLERMAVQMAIAIRQAEISSEKQQLEEKFLRTQRLESLGTLASGIAHDLNNILTPILGIAQLLPIKLEEVDPSTQQMLDILHRSAQRGSDIVKQVLSFARGNDDAQTSLNLSHLLQEIYEFAQNTFPRSIKIENQSDSHLWKVEGHATPIHQVLMNLLINARDAMPSGGQLILKASNLRLDETYNQSNADAQLGAYVRISVVDTGLGIADEHLNQIFEPFFTTKAEQAGTGLGLSTVLGIVREHGGFMEVSSTLGRGTEFQVFLPASHHSIPVPLQEPDPAIGQGQLILVVDDEAAIRTTTQTALEAYGYRVLCAQDGMGAIALFSQNTDKFRAVLIDMMMPVMDGGTAIRTLRELDSQVKIIAMSGLAFPQSSETHPVKHDADAWLAKPYTTTQLLKTLQTLLTPTVQSHSGEVKQR